MAEFNVSYEMSFWMKVKAKNAVEAEWIAERNPSAPFYNEEDGRKQGILYSAAGEPHDFSVVRVPRRPVARRGQNRKRSSLAATSAKARGGRKAGRWKRGSGPAPPAVPTLEVGLAGPRGQDPSTSCFPDAAISHRPPVSACPGGGFSSSWAAVTSPARVWLRRPVCPRQSPAGLPTGDAAHRTW